MKFTELKKEITNSYANPDVTTAAYLSYVQMLDVLEDDIPPYVRKIRTAFLGSFTLQGLADVCRAKGTFHNIVMECYTAPYNQFSQSILSSSDLYAFNPQLIYMAVDAPDLLNDAHLCDLVTILEEKTNAIIIVFNFVARPRVNDARAAELNMQLSEQFKNNSRVHIFDFASWLERMGREKYWYTKYKELGDLRIAPSAFPALAESLLEYAVAASGSTKKCVVLDLDNTLWQGIVGEDGPDGIVPDRKLQSFLLTLFEKGIILVINSKNNLEDALQAIEQNPHMILGANHFAAWRINWDSKEKNMIELAEELNLGLESFVFVDDDPFQRELICAAFPEVAVLPPELLYAYAGFHSFAITQEDRQRTTMYAQERMRKDLQKSLKTEEDFLKELNLQVTMNELSDDAIARVSQLTQKTNQFNLTTRRYSEDDIRKRREKGWRIWSVAVNDRFGDYGIVGVVMIEPREMAWHIDTFLLSCRVLGRRVEHQVVECLREEAAARHVAAIHAAYLPTAKNGQTQHFWKSMGFTVVSESPDTHQKNYRYELTS